MRKINLAISGCLGRMGQQLIKSSSNNKKFKLVTLTENRLINRKFNNIKPELNSEKAFKKIDMIIDFTLSENKVLMDGGWEQFDHIVFVSAWQRDQYIIRFGIPYSKCSVIPNAVEKRYEAEEKNTETIRFIYHTTPHRGLELLYPVFDALSKEYDNIHLDVYSSFAIYGWEQRDKPYAELFEQIKQHSKMTYHGSVSNEEVLEALDKAHIFLYPNIWRETSCIAMIEAIKSGVICIHPNLGALPETASNATIMYDFTENNQDHANLAYSITKSLLEHQENDPQFINRFTRSDRFGLAPNDINTYRQYWNKLLRDLLN